MFPVSWRRTCSPSWPQCWYKVTHHVWTRTLVFWVFPQVASQYFQITPVKKATSFYIMTLLFVITNLHCLFSALLFKKTYQGIPGNTTFRDIYLSFLPLPQVVESCLEGVCKPDPRMYKLCLEQLGWQPSESIFLDDLGPNLKAAVGLGIHTIKVMVTVFWTPLCFRH